MFAGKTGFYNQRYANYLNSIRNMLYDEFVQIVAENARKGWGGLSLSENSGNGSSDAIYSSRAF